MNEPGHTYLRIRNWDKFQHYKKDGPVAWIKLHTKLLSDYEFGLETELNQIRILKIWLLAAQTGGLLPQDKDWIRKRISAKTLDLDGLISRGWLEPVYSNSSLRREEVHREEVPRENTDLIGHQQRLDNLVNIKQLTARVTGSVGDVA